VEVLGCIPEYQLHYVSVTGGTIISKQGVYVSTERVKNIDFSGILLIPGGQGTRPLVNEPEFIKNLKHIAMQSKYCLTVCTGSALLAKTGLLDNRQATSNKNALEWVQSINRNVHWMNRARWNVDQKYYTSLGISAGIDRALGFTADRFGHNRAQEIAKSIEYIWNSSPN
ncbi:DJ-1/PfpI family protein, partial [Ethanoligenens sp.]|uniref:DJ-1/PfpI family protein n=1 Tax=Ethanoligenens sp. TaxID=2099655 RepID=UPI0039E939E6